MKGWLSFWVVALIGWFIFSGYWYTCKINGLCWTSNAAVSSAGAKDRSDAPVIAPQKKFTLEEGDFSVQCDDNVQFEYSKARPILSEKVKDAFLKIKDHLGKGDDKNLEIIGSTAKNEPNNSNEFNLGWARAKGLKEHLSGLGIPEEKIITSSSPENDVLVENGKVYGGVNYQFRNISADDKQQLEEKNRIESVENELKAFSRNVYFEPNTSVLIIDEKLALYFDNLIAYLGQFSDKKVNLIGHCDNTGSTNSNYAFGMKRANYVKNYLVKKGVKNNQISVSSKGEGAPIDTNDTVEGRAKNRRVEILI